MTVKDSLSMAFGILLSCMAALSHADSAQPPLKLSFAAADWCPYTCDNQDQQGFIVEAAKEAFASQNIELIVTVLPWTRAIKMTEQGKYDGLMTAIESEVPEFTMTSAQTGDYQMCLFTRTESNFEYQDRASIRGITLGAIQDYGYGEPLDSMILEPGIGENIYLISSSDPLLSLVEMTRKKRIDTFAEDQMVVSYYLKRHPKVSLRNAGCLESIPFYTAISPARKDAQNLSRRLSRILESAEYKLRYAEARQRYGLKSQ